jgi:hypothetical protein
MIPQSQHVVKLNGEKTLQLKKKSENHRCNVPKLSDIIRIVWGNFKKIENINKYDERKSA